VENGLGLGAWACDFIQYPFSRSVFNTTLEPLILGREENLYKRKRTCTLYSKPAGKVTMNGHTTTSRE
jgi:hypothetical protein